MGITVLTKGIYDDGGLNVGDGDVTGGGGGGRVEFRGSPQAQRPPLQKSSNHEIGFIIKENQQGVSGGGGQKAERWGAPRHIKAVPHPLKKNLYICSSKKCGSTFTLINYLFTHFLCFGTPNLKYPKI